MPSGTIARLLIDKGFGFIRDESGIEHFFHRSSVRGSVFELLREGQRVEFTPEDSGKGPRAEEGFAAAFGRNRARNDVPSVERAKDNSLARLRATWGSGKELKGGLS